MKAYAAQLAILDHWPRTIQRLVMASTCMNTKVTRKSLDKLEAREDFVQLVNTYRAEESQRVRGIIESHLQEGVKQHMAGLKMAVEEKDHRAIPKFTVPLLERAWPKQEESQPAVPMIEIHIGQGSAQVTRMLAAPAVEEVQDAEYEIVTDDRPSD